MSTHTFKSLDAAKAFIQGIELVNDSSLTTLPPKKIRNKKKWEVDVEEKDEIDLINVGGFVAGDVESQAAERGIELTNEQILEVLYIMEKRFDASIGMSWDVIDMCIDEYLEEEPTGEE